MARNEILKVFRKVRVCR